MLAPHITEINRKNLPPDGGPGRPRFFSSCRRNWPAFLSAEAEVRVARAHRHIRRVNKRRRLSRVQAMSSIIDNSAVGGWSIWRDGHGYHVVDASGEKLCTIYPRRENGLKNPRRG